VVKIMARTKSIVDELRKAIAQAEKRGLTRYRIAKLSGMALPVLVRIANGTTIPRLDTAAKIASGIGCRLTLITK
jgi:transcriptional regulator with XRE-family HTH domain